jgi:hypothetical protein
MTSAASLPERLVSAASIDGVWFELPVSRTALTEYLRRFGPLSVERGRGPDRDRHWISIEVWTVTNGRLVLAGADQHDSAARLAGVGAGLLGAAWGANLGWMASVATGNVRGLSDSVRAGAERGFELSAGLAGQRAREVSRAFTLGPYHELLVGVPNVSLRGAAGRYTAVLGMVTDDDMARSIDRYFGYGYNKQPGTFEFGSDGSFRVEALGGPFLSVEIRDARRAPLAPRSVCGAMLNRRWDLPLLGGLQDGRWTCSRLDRRINGPGASGSQVHGRIEVRGDLFDVPFSRRYSLGRVASTGARAVVFTGVPTQISQPRRALRSNETRSQARH